MKKSRISQKTETIKVLTEITDEGFFEKLVTSILRASNPLYESIAHCGINKDGKTKKDPFDGITFIHKANPPHMIVIHHTITKIEDLEAKWLKDPSKVRQKPSTKTKTIPGDLIKTAEEYKEYKRESPLLKCTLVLTTNKLLSSHLRTKAEFKANEFGIYLDLWDASRISYFLDCDPNGQYIRYKYLGVNQERLSRQYLNELSLKSLNDFPFFDDKKQWITRKFDEELSDTTSLGINFIVGESGQGKTVSCVRYLTKIIQNSGYGIIVTPDEIENSYSIENLIYNHISKLNKFIVESSGSDALNYTTMDNPFVILVEDINKSNNLTKVLDKLLNWHIHYFKSIKIDGNEEKIDEKIFWKILCPLWEKNLFKEKEIIKNIPMLNCSSFTVEEGTQAVLKKYLLQGESITDLNAKEIASEMGYDPFIIGLMNLEEKINPRDVINKFIFDNLKELSQTKGDFIESEYYSLLKDLVLKIYKNYLIEPTWSDITNFNLDSNQIKMIRQISTQGKIFKLVGAIEAPKIKFRHDRLQEWIASIAITEKFNDKDVTKLLSEPYYSRIISLVLNKVEIKAKDIKKIRDLNPLSLFYSLKDFEEAKTDKQKSVISNIIAWLKDGGTQNKSKTNLRLYCLHILSQTDSSHVTEILRYFQDRRNWYYPKAGFRNGDINLGIDLCSHFEPGWNNISHELLIQHAITKYHDNFVCRIKNKLKDASIPEKQLSGVLRICGYLSDPDLYNYLKESWNNSNKEKQKILLDDYLWACAQCCGDKPEVLLNPIFEMWASLPSENKANGLGSERDQFASNVVRWAFEKYIPKNAIEYFVSQTKRKELEWPITYMIHGIDHPIVVTYMASYLAQIQKKSETEKLHIFFSSQAIRVWEDKQERGNILSDNSRSKLLEIWENKSNNKYLRKQSFRLWAATKFKTDLEILQKHIRDRVLKDDILIARLKRSDSSAINQLVVKLKKDNFLWWNTRNVWSDDLTSAFENYLGKVSTKIRLSSKKELTAAESITYELLMRLPIATGEKLLLKYWENLKKCNDYIQVALYIATDKMIELATLEINSHKNPKDVFKYINFRYGIRTIGHPGVTRERQLEVLIPFLKYIDMFCIYEFWDLCNEKGWFDFRWKYLDKILRGSKWDIYISKENILKSLDEKISKNHLSFFDHWINDFKKTGVSAKEIIKIVFEWVNLQDKTNPKVLDVAIQTVWYVGSRSDFLYLRYDIYKNINIFDDMFENEYYEIRRRTLQ